MKKHIYIVGSVLFVATAVFSMFTWFSEPNTSAAADCVWGMYNCGWPPPSSTTSTSGIVTTNTTPPGPAPDSSNLATITPTPYDPIILPTVSTKNPKPTDYNPIILPTVNTTPGQGVPPSPGQATPTPPSTPPGIGNPCPDGSRSGAHPGGFCPVAGFEPGANGSYCRSNGQQVGVGSRVADNPGDVLNSDCCNPGIVHRLPVGQGGFRNVVVCGEAGGGTFTPTPPPGATPTPAGGGSGGNNGGSGNNNTAPAPGTGNPCPSGGRSGDYPGGFCPVPGFQPGPNGSYCRADGQRVGIGTRVADNPGDIRLSDCCNAGYVERLPVGGTGFRNVVVCGSAPAGSYTVTVRDNPPPPAGSLGDTPVRTTPTPTPTKLTCSPATQTVAVNKSARLTATAGTGSYVWKSPEASFTYVNGVYSPSYPTTGTKTVTVTSGSETATCKVVVVPAGQAPNTTVAQFANGARCRSWAASGPSVCSAQCESGYAVAIGTPAADGTQLYECRER